jgi:menaquinone-dependent protoporphyrinogen IX oxidase
MNNLVFFATRDGVQRRIAETLRTKVEDPLPSGPVTGSGVPS